MDTLVLALASKVTHLDVALLGVPLSVLAGGVGTIAATGALARRLDHAARAKRHAG